MSCFNVIFTFLPPLAIGIFDQFVSARMLDKYPQLYILGQHNEFFNQRKFWGWFANAIFHSLVSPLLLPRTPAWTLLEDQLSNSIYCLV